jgi:hypothetical protein
MKLKNTFAAATIATALAIGGTVATAAPASAYEVLFVYTYSSASTCSQATDRYAQRYDIIQGCTVISAVNGVPTQWRLMVGRA